MQLKYIELKSGLGHSGPAWIAYVEISKSGRTLYFDGKAFKPLKGKALSANYYEIESGDHYWISNPKKNGEDRHQFGGGKIYVQATAVAEYFPWLGIFRS